MYGATQREVRDKLAAIRRTLDAGLPVGTRRPMAVGDYLEAWLRPTPPTVVRPSTVASYASLTRQHIIPGLGHHRLDRLTAVHIRAFLRNKSTQASPRTKRPLSSRTMQYLHPGNLVGAFKQPIRSASTTFGTQLSPWTWCTRSSLTSVS